MQKGHVNAALKRLTDNMTVGILPLNDETLDLLRQKHPKARNRQEVIRYIARSNEMIKSYSI